MRITYGCKCIKCGFQKLQMTCEKCGGLFVWDTDKQCAICTNCGNWGSEVVWKCQMCGFENHYNKDNMIFTEPPSIGSPNIIVVPIERPSTTAAQPASLPSGPSCPTCNGATQFISQYNQYFCYHCQKYVALPNPPCPTCNGVSRFITQYKRYYCDRCKKYI
jgi:hypothetical protein